MQIPHREFATTQEANLVLQNLGKTWWTQRRLLKSFVNLLSPFGGLDGIRRSSVDYHLAGLTKSFGRLGIPSSQ